MSPQRGRRVLLFDVVDPEWMEISRRKKKAMIHFPPISMGNKMYAYSLIFEQNEMRNSQYALTAHSLSMIT